MWDEDDFGSWMADKAAEGPAGVARQGGVLLHKGDLNPAGVVRKLQSASLTWTRYKGEPLLQPIKDVVTVESSRIPSAKRRLPRGGPPPAPPEVAGR